MAAFRRRLSFVGIGVLGAVAHNGGQLGAAMLLLGPALLAYAPLAAARGAVRRCGDRDYPERGYARFGADEWIEGKKTRRFRRPAPLWGGLTEGGAQ